MNQGIRKEGGIKETKLKIKILGKIWKKTSLANGLYHI